MIKSGEAFFRKQEKLSALIMLHQFPSGQNARHIFIRGLTPLHLAIISENTEAIKLLEDAMRDPMFNHIKSNCPLPIHKLYEIFFPQDLAPAIELSEPCNHYSFK